jgi:uncharacterized protein involved in exopolysaccharide biosynthesis
MEQDNFQSEDFNQNEVSLVETFFHYFSYWKIFVISIIACLVIACIYLLYATSLYRVTSRIIINDNTKSQTSMDFNAFKDLGIITPTTNLGNEVEVLNSKTLMTSVADSLNLKVSYFEKRGLRRQLEIYKGTPVFVYI